MDPLQWLREDLVKLDGKINDVNSKVDVLLQFKWKVVGGTIVASLLLTALFDIVLAIIGK